MWMFYAWVSYCSICCSQYCPTYKKKPPEIHDAWSLAPNALPMTYRQDAKVVWSINATKSTVEHAKKI